MKGRHTFSAVVVGLALLTTCTAIAQAATRPDDRPGPLGVGVQAVAPDTSDVVSRYVSRRADQSDAISRYLGRQQTGIKPDDRPGPLGVGPTEPATPVASASSGFNWGDAGIGAGAALGFAFAAAGGLLLLTHRMPRVGRIGASAAG